MKLWLLLMTGAIVGMTGASVVGAVSVLRLEVLSVRDSDQMIGGEAFRMLIPAGWKSEGGVFWRWHPVIPASVHLRVYNPNGVEELDMLPNILCTWSDGGIAFFPPGSVYLGNEVRQPIADPIQCLRQLVLPRYGKQLPPYQIVSSEELPKLAEAARLQNPACTIMRAGKVRLNYRQNGKDIEQDVYCTVGIAPAPAIASVFWGIDNIVAFRAEKGKLDQQQKVLETMLFSVRLNLQWFNKYLQLVEFLKQSQIQQSNRAADLSRYIARTNDHITETIRQGYEHRQQVMDRVNDNFDQHIRGVDRYTNPADNSRVELPAGYGNAWVNARGEYVVSDNANFNPNVDLKQGSWQRLQKGK